jgi:hypothetical protein
MSTNRTDRGDDDLMRRYREASAAANEQPGASTRASILAAAARQVHAKPTDAKLPYRRARWPLAAAAAVMLSTLAVMLAIRTNEELPQFGAPPDAGSASRAPAAPDSEPLQQELKAAEEVQLQSKPAREQPAEQRADGARQSGDTASEPKRAVPASTRAKTETTDRPTESRANENRVRESARTPADASPPSAARPSSPVPPPVAAAPPAPASAPAPLAKQRAEAEAGAALQGFGQSGAAVRPKEAKPQAAASAERDARQDAAGALSSASRAEAPAARDEIEGSAATWLERIIRLRREGRHDEAEAELKRFRERYPQVQVPPQALPPIVRP